MFQPVEKRFCNLLHSWDCDRHPFPNKKLVMDDWENLTPGEKKQIIEAYNEKYQTEIQEYRINEDEAEEGFEIFSGFGEDINRDLRGTLEKIFGKGEGITEHFIEKYSLYQAMQTSIDTHLTLYHSMTREYADSIGRIYRKQN